jgi:uncharacterized protein (DUF305 family)
MDESIMGMMTEMKSGVGDPESMAAMMDAEGLVAAFCAGEDSDLTFIDLTIPQHQMAISASEAALGQATPDEIRDVAERVIANQQQEIDELTQIRQELTEAATPVA